MSRKRMFDSVIEKVIGSSFLEGGEDWLEFKKGEEKEEHEEVLEDLKWSKKELYSELRSIFVVRVKKNFESAVSEFEKGLPMISEVMSKIREEFSGGYEVYALEFFEKLPYVFEQALEEVSDVAFYLHAVYRGAKKSVTGSVTGKESKSYVRSVIKCCAEGLYEKLYISVGDVRKFYELLERFYEELEEAKSKIREAGNGQHKKGLSERVKRRVRLVFESFVDEVREVFSSEGLMNELAKRMVELGWGSLKIDKAKSYRRKARRSMT